MTIRPREPLAATGYYMVGISNFPGFDAPYCAVGQDEAITC